MMLDPQPKTGHERWSKPEAHIWRAIQDVERRDYRATEAKLHHRLGMSRWFEESAATAGPEPDTAAATSPSRDSGSMLPTPPSTSQLPGVALAPPPRTAPATASSRHPQTDTSSSDLPIRSTGERETLPSRSARARLWRPTLRQPTAALIHALSVVGGRIGSRTSDESSVRRSAVTEGEQDLRLTLGQAFGEGGLHVICHETGKITPKGKKAAALGKGGAGSVYPCLYGAHKQRRAVKFLTLNKLEPGRTGRRREDFEATFADERAILSQLSHSHISIFHEDGVHVDGENEWHYLVTDHIAGPMLVDALSQEGISGEEIYKIISDLLDAVTYLHHRGVYHCDIKLDNIRMRAPGSNLYDVVLLDWGAAQVLAPLGENAQSRLDISVDPKEQRRFISTSAITHEHHLAYLRGGTYSPAELQDIVPPHELHTLGVLLHAMTDPDREWSARVRTKLSRTLGDQGIRVLDEIIEDLKASPTGDGYSSVDQVHADFKKLHRNYLSPAGVPELSLAAEFQYSVPTATGRAVMTRRISRVTDHRLVNRLHQVHQLESTYLTFPGATHTRLGHSLAVLRNARYYVSHLLNDSRFRRQAEREDLEAALLLALLHDIGHFQLSHMFEDLATDQASDRGAESWRAIQYDVPTDDTLFADVLGAPGESRLRGGYRELIGEAAVKFEAGGDPDAAVYQSIWDIICDSFGEPTARSLLRLHEITYAQTKPSDATPAQRVLAAVLSSDIDADKTAYLVEDAKRTGVVYGLGVDLDGILGNVCMPTPEDFERSSPNPVIGIRRAGVQAALSVAINRNQMLSQVYWHYSNRAITAMVKYPIMRLLSERKLVSRF